MRNTLKIITLIFFCFQIASCANCLSGNSEEEQALFDQIKVGMTNEEVTKILGNPSHIFVDSVSDIKYSTHTYFSKNKGGRSELPYVKFDSSGKVVSSYYY